MESIILTTVPLEDARHLCRELQHHYGDGFDIRPTHDPGSVEIWGPALAQDFVEGYIAAIWHHPNRRETIQRSREYTATSHLKKEVG